MTKAKTRTPVCKRILRANAIYEELALRAMRSSSPQAGVFDAGSKMGKVVQELGGFLDSMWRANKCGGQLIPLGEMHFEEVVK